ncbi:hypothetical protein [Raoultibacter phocaeensis]|uniref:hypothetical protein n=1 Tax=Raoultibacter phocaeensis TaxID=2479841 RepID=UPI00111935EA|nr:hypothetical protein [Raoultibacter phocaeensis]
MTAKKSTKTTAVVTLSLAAAFLLITVVFGFNIGGIAGILPTAGKAVWGFAGCTVALAICGVAALLHKPTSSELVSEADERNVAIRSRAAERAFNVLSVLVPIGALALFAFDQITMAGVLIMVAVEVIAFVAYLAWIANLQKSM